MSGVNDDSPYLCIRNLTKRFGAFTALSDISLDVREREFICFLGPSGCGKTTLLRAIAGLDIQTGGKIEQAQRDISVLPPVERDFGIVFQSYALFPNLTVAGNIAYGLENEKKSKSEIKTRVDELLNLVGMPDQADKYPAQLSGGQQQRVALARAIAISPGLLLLDEPLSALDAKVRVKLRHEIKALQRKLGVTTIMVTHDQEEALTMADRIVVMNQGIIEQVGTPQEIYHAPATRFVADFIGTMNFLAARQISETTVQVGELILQCKKTEQKFTTPTVVAAIRPEDIIVGKSDENTIPVEIAEIEFLGAFGRAELIADNLGDIKITADFSANLMKRENLSKGMKISVSLPKDRIRIYPT